MKILTVLRKGAVKSALSYRYILIIWVITLSMLLLVAIPLKSGFNSIFGRSLLTERFIDGFDLGLLGDIGPSFKILISEITNAGFLILLAGFLLYTFFSGGLFTRYTTEFGDFSTSSFMKASAIHFPAFLGVGILSLILTVLWTIIVAFVPSFIATAVTEDSYKALGIAKIFVPIWLLGLPLCFLVADNSRRWIASTGSHKIFKALSEGFTSLGKGFITSYLSILIVFVVNLIFLILVVLFVADTVPEKGWIVFLFFLATQLLLIIRLFLRAWRYATVTELALRHGE